MTPISYISMIGFFVLVAWRLVLPALRWRHLPGVGATPWERRGNAQRYGHPVRALVDLSANEGNRFDNGSDGAGSVSRKDRAEAYLRRVVALTGATQTAGVYVLDVGKIRFEVRHRFVSRFEDSADPKSRCQETCFYPVHKEMPRAEEIATALLQLASNPDLFDKWAAQNGQAFKADGHVFAHTL